MECEYEVPRSNAGSPFDRLPDEVVLCILQETDAQTLGAWALTSRRHQQLAVDDSIWRHLHETHFGPSLFEAPLPEHVDWRWMYRAQHHQARPTGPDIGIVKREGGYYTFRGDVLDGQPHGFGIEVKGLCTASVRADVESRLSLLERLRAYVGRVQGNWVHGKLDGMAIEMHTDGSKTERLWIHGEPEPHGTMTYPSGARYRGTFFMARRTDVAHSHSREAHQSIVTGTAVTRSKTFPMDTSVSTLQASSRRVLGSTCGPAVRATTASLREDRVTAVVPSSAPVAPSTRASGTMTRSTVTELWSTATATVTRAIGPTACVMATAHSRGHRARSTRATTVRACATEQARCLMRTGTCTRGPTARGDVGAAAPCPIPTARASRPFGTTRRAPMPGLFFTAPATILAVQAVRAAHARHCLTAARNDAVHICCFVFCSAVSLSRPRTKKDKIFLGHYHLYFFLVEIIVCAFFSFGRPAKGQEKGYKNSSVDQKGVDGSLESSRSQSSSSSTTEGG